MLAITMPRNTPERFEFEFDPAYRPFLTGISVTPSRAWVELGDSLRVRFGLWGMETPASNISDVCITGPYMAVRAIGLRLSLTDHGVTFGTSVHGGVCVLFHEPIPGVSWFRLFRHPGATVTVRDREGFAEAVRARVGPIG